MTERYERIYTLPKNQYVKTCPAILLAGALLKDNLSNEMLVQLKFKNISNKTIKAIEVEIISRDIADRQLGEKTTYHYLDLDVNRDDEFGSKSPIILASNITRSFSVRIIEIVFFDKSLWQGTNVELEVLTPIEKLPYSGELLKQFKIKYGKMSKYNFASESDIWFCTCGSINHINEKCCHTCLILKEDLENIDVNTLYEEIKVREANYLKKQEQRLLREKELELQKEKATQEKILIKKERKEQIQTKSLTILKKSTRAIILLFVILCLVYGGITFYNAEVYTVELNKAQKYYNYGNYVDAVDSLTQYDVQESQDLLQEIMLSYMVDKYIPYVEQLITTVDEYIYMYESESLYQTGEYTAIISEYLSTIEELDNSLSSIYSEYNKVFSSDILDQMPESLQDLDIVFSEYALYVSEYYSYDEVTSFASDFGFLCINVRSFSSKGSSYLGYSDVDDISYQTYETELNDYYLKLEEKINSFSVEN